MAADMTFAGQWTPSKPSVKTIEYKRHPNFPPVTAEKEGK